MRNRLLPLVMLAVVAIFALYARRPVSNTHPSTAGPVTTRNPAAADAAPDSPESDRRRGPRARTAAQPGTFDFYLLNLSWSPEFCATHPGQPECAAHPRFVLHGLWPQNNDGTFPEDCSSAPGPTDPGAFKDILPDTGLLTHEWQTHGTCSGLAPDAYFTLARSAFHAVIIPPSLNQLSAPASRTPASILADFARANPSISAASLALSCGNNELTAVEVCFDRNLSAVSCSGVRSCRANSVRITPPGGSTP